jgi:hypothetical protein
MKWFLTVCFLYASLNDFGQPSMFVANGNTKLYKVNVHTCTATLIGGMGAQFIDIALTEDGRLWGIQLNGDLYHIDTVTAACTFFGANGLPWTRALVGLNDSTVLTESNGNLYGIRVNTASSYLIGNVGLIASGDLAWYDNDLYMFCTNDVLIKIQLDGTNTSVVNVDTVPNLTPQVYAGATAAFPGYPNSIVVFVGFGAWKICQIDAIIDILCPTLFTEGEIWGAATLRLPVQEPQPLSCLPIATGTLSIPQIKDLSVSSDPGFGKIMIRDLPDNCKASVYNVIGIQMFESQINTLQCEIDIHNYTAGIYFVKISQGAKSIVKKFVKY